MKSKIGTGRLSGHQLSRKWNVPERTLNQILRDAGAQPKGGHDPIEAALFVIEHFKKLAKEADSDAARDRARTTKAQADIAEMERGKMMRTLVPRADYYNNWADCVAQGVRNISKLNFLSKKEKEEVFAAIRNIKLPKIEE